MSMILGLYKYARKRFLQAELDKLTEIEKDREICTMIAFMVGAGISSDYQAFKYKLLQAQSDAIVLQSMEDERNE